jgi:hypothetical protein
LSGKGRFVNFAPIAIDYDLTTGRYTCLGRTKDATAETTWRLIGDAGALDGTPRSVTEIARLCGLLSPTEKIGGQLRKRITAALANRPDVARADGIRGGQKTILFRRLEAE